MEQKKEYIAVDIAKLFWAFTIVALHIPPLNEILPQGTFWLSQVFCRIAVPYFFVASGYFIANKLEDNNAVKKQIKRLLWLYGVYSVLHLNLIIYDFKIAGTDWVDIILDILFLGTYLQLWYLVGLVVAIIMLYVCVRVWKWDAKKLIVASVILYVLGILGNGYSPLLEKIPVLNTIADAYFAIFRTTRNGFFMGYPMVTMGYLINKSPKEKKGNVYMFLGALALLTIEAYLAKNFIGLQAASMYFTLPLVVYFCFNWTISVKINAKYEEIGRACRYVSFLVYGLHMFINMNFGKYISYRVSRMDYFIIIAASSFVAGLVIVWMSKFKYFKWLKWFY